MELFFSTKEIWQLAVIKLLFYVFVASGIFFYFKFKKPILFVGLISLFSAGSYFFLALHSQRPWWGLQGDEIFTMAFLEKVASGQFFSDFFYGNLPPFYPPLYFWVVGGLGYLFKLNGIQAGRLGVILVLFFLPLVVYFWQWLYWRKKDGGKPAGWQLVLAPALIMVVAEPTAIIFKPYEFISAVLVVLWAVFLMLELENKTFNLWKMIVYGISGGLLFTLFYFWFFPVVLAVALFKLSSRIKSLYYFGYLLLVAFFAILVSLPYILPLVFSYLTLGAENWQPAFFIPQDLNSYLPFFKLSIFGLTALFGLGAIIFYRSRPYARILGWLLISAYLWQLINLITLIFCQASFLPTKLFLFFGGAILSIAAAYGLGEFISEKIKNENLKIVLFCLGWLVLASQLLGGSFIDEESTRQQFLKTKQPVAEEIGDLVGELKTVEDLDHLTILASGMPELSAFLPLDYYISYNIHFSHPAANFSRRYYFIAELAASPTPEAFYKKLKEAPFESITGLLFYKTDKNYPIFFWLDNYPLGGKEDVINIPVNLVSEDYFDKLFEDKYFIFYKLK